MVHAAVAELPHDMPRLAQGVSSPAAVLAAVAAGVDLFDTGFATVSTAAGVALTFSVSDPAQEANGDAEARSPSAASVDLKDTRCACLVFILMPSSVLRTSSSTGARHVPGHH